MKKFLFATALCIGVFLNSSAQATDQEIGLIGSILKSEVKVFFAQNMELSTSEAETFWSIYDEYENELKPLSNQRIDFLKSLIEKGGELTEDELDDKVKLGVKINKKRISLRYKYYKTLKKQLSIKVAAQFYQIDAYIYTHISASLHEGMPLIVPTKSE
ncbi:hypothetical protein [Carboxylicivirga marina]|uniref:Uncharacterized protein n=1 Tax=Carboxylicivirga marina TaxID=2800988 RepID=A0ABS1HIY0_9BACT|nr:hypothetical protein [Carboxylicivirga marina]MBK3517626.1 hypothetical protein [Carboxylicivirga marina]